MSLSQKLSECLEIFFFLVINRQILKFASTCLLILISILNLLLPLLVSLLSATLSHYPNPPPPIYLIFIYYDIMIIVLYYYKL